MTTHLDYSALNDYADNLVGHGRRADMDAHLANCADCRSTLAAIKDLQRQAGALPRERNAPAEVWQNIRAATIESSSSQRRRVVWGMRYQLAAAAVVLLVATASVTWYFAGGRSPSIAQPTPPTPAVHLAAYQEVEAEYMKAANNLMTLLEQHRSGMDTAVVRVVEENLRVMDDAITRARAALLSDPSNQAVAGIWAATQQSKLRMLRRAVASGT